LPVNSIVVLEDVDALFTQDDERKERTNISFSGFINTFDGINTPQDCVVFMTTNKLDAIDDAIKRRIHKYVEFKEATKEQIYEMFDTFFPAFEQLFPDFYQNICGVPVTINIIEKFFIMHLFDDIIMESKNFAKFANGELRLKSSNTKNLYT
jgi:SpoVK/Ycf46/Vps4 family AAA+-type ATPase